MILEGVKKAILKEWKGVEDPIGGGIDKVYDGVAIVRYKDGGFGIQNLDADDGEPYTPFPALSGEHPYIMALERARDVINGWIEYYTEFPESLEKFLRGEE